MRPETNTESRESTPRKILRKAGKPLLYLALGAGGAMVLAGAARGAAPGGAVDNFFTKTIGGAFKFGRDRMHGVRNAYHARNAGIAKTAAPGPGEGGAAKSAGEKVAKDAAVAKAKAGKEAVEAGAKKAGVGGEAAGKVKMSFDPDAKVGADTAGKDAAAKAAADKAKDDAAKAAVKKAAEVKKKGAELPPPDVKKAAEDKAKDEAAKAAAKKAAEMKAKPPPPPGLEID